MTGLRRSATNGSSPSAPRWRRACASGASWSTRSVRGRGWTATSTCGCRTGSEAPPYARGVHPLFVKVRGSPGARRPVYFGTACLAVPHREGPHMQPTWQDSLQHSFGPHLPYILGGIAILLVGWIVALVAGSLTRKGLDAANANQRLAAHTQSKVDIERIAGRIVFWAILLMAVVGALSVMHVDGVTGPLAGFVGTIIPAAVLALVAWLVATRDRVVVNKAMAATQLDEKLSEKANAQPMSHTLGNVAFWLVLLLFLPAIVGVLQIEGLMEPLSAMMTKLLAMLPNLL